MITPPASELESLVRREVARRLWMWGAIAVIPLLLLALAVLYLVIEFRALSEASVRRDEPLLIYNPTWDTAIDGVNPGRFPGRHQDDARKGIIVQQWPVHGGPEQIWELRRPYGPRFQGADPVTPRPETPKPIQP